MSIILFFIALKRIDSARQGKRPKNFWYWIAVLYAAQWLLGLALTLVSITMTM